MSKNVRSNDFVTAASHLSAVVKLKLFTLSYWKKLTL